jgi:hypothetical protein
MDFRRACRRHFRPWQIRTFDKVPSIIRAQSQHLEIMVSAAILIDFSRDAEPPLHAAVVRYQSGAVPQ